MRSKRTKAQIEYDNKHRSKVCTGCDTRKSFDDYFNTKKHSDGKATRCKLCTHKAHMVWRGDNTELYAAQQRDLKLKRLYGIDSKTYEDMLEAQGGVCAICGQEERMSNRRLAVDHDHLTGKVRGLLCADCNKALGHFKDNVSIIEVSLKYLRRYSNG